MASFTSMERRVASDSGSPSSNTRSSQKGYR